MPLRVHVNIVGEWSGLREDIAQVYLEHFDNINCVLAHNGLPAHQEPDHVVQWDEDDANRQYMETFPGQCLEYLKRAYVVRRMMANLHPSQAGYVPVEGLIPPVGAEGIGYWIPAVLQETQKKESHLLYHSDHEGVYLPIESMKIPVASSDPGLPLFGGVVGSSCRLLDELIDLATGLGIQLQKDDSLSPEEANRLYTISNTTNHPYANEICAWLTLHESCELSMRYGTAVVFVQV